MAFKLGRRTDAAALCAIGVARPRHRRRPARRSRFRHPRQRAGGLRAPECRRRLSFLRGGDAMTGSEKRRGVVLVTVLWSIALLSALAMAASVTFRGFTGVMTVERDRVQGDALLSAGLETAAGIIDTLGDAPLLDIEAKVNLATGPVRSRLSDEGGRIDVGKAPAVVLAALLRSVGATEAAANDVAQRIVERRYPGNAARPNTALRSTNVATRPPGTGQPFSDVRQLQLIPGMLPDWVAAIAP